MIRKQTRAAVAIESLEARQLLAGQLLYSEGFESGANGWFNDQYLSTDNRKAWTISSARAHSGGKSAGTTLPSLDSVFASPAINLPGVNQYAEHLYLNWWQFADYASRGGSAASIPVVREFVGDLGTWGPWNVIDPNTNTTPTYTKTWGRVGLDLTQFAGGRVQIGFHHYGYTNGAPGWFVDDVQITREKVMKPWTGDTSFENGFNGWTTTRGMWNVGSPVGTTAPTGGKVAGTGLNGTPPAAFDSSLVSPAFYLPKNGTPVTLEFKSHLDRHAAAIITVEFQFWMPSKGWSPVNNVSADGFDTVLNGAQPDGKWKTFKLPLTNSLGGAGTLPHRLLFTAFAGVVNGRGWTIDDVKLNYAGKPTTTPKPEVAVFNPYGELTDGVTSVRWGTYKKNTGGKDITFTVRNTGTAALTLGTITLDRNVGFQVVSQGAKTVAAGSFTTFKIRLLTTSAGNKSAAVRFLTNDASENPFNFNITGVVTA